MGVTRVQRITMPKSGQAVDQTVNSFYFSKADDTLNLVAGDVTSVASALDDLFNLAVGAGDAVRFYLAESTMATQRVTYKFYNMSDPSPRVPYATPVAQNTTPVISTAALPSEVACCLSFKSLVVSGSNAARGRGRVFIGPLNTAALEVEAATGQPRVAARLQTALCAGANRMYDSLFAGPGISWVIYSPTKRSETGGSAFSSVSGIKTAWCDNAFDTQRRRGVKTTARTTLDVWP